MPLCTPLATPSIRYALLSSLGDAMYNNLMLQTTIGVITSFSNHYYEASRWTAVYWVSFTFLVNMLLAKLLIAVSYSSYRAHLREKLVRKVASRKKALAAAFDLLSVDGEVHWLAWERLCGHKKSLRKQVGERRRACLFVDVFAVMWSIVVLRAGKGCFSAHADCRFQSACHSMMVSDRRLRWCSDQC